MQNHEAWAIPYGDLVTLLLAFFVVMYSISSVNEGKYRVVSDSLNAAFRGAPTTTVADPGRERRRPPPLRRRSCSCRPDVKTMALRQMAEQADRSPESVDHAGTGGCADG